MNIRMNPKTGLPEIEIDPQDLSDGQHIAAMLESEGWKRLLPYIAFARKALEDDGKKKSRLANCDSKMSAALCWARLDGFDHFTAIIERVISKSEEVNLKQKQEGNYEPSYNGE